MNVLVTGGAGFIGANLCRRLLATPAVTEVRVIDDLSTGHIENLATLDVRFLHGTILDADLLADAAKGCDAIVHLAAVPSVPRSVENPTRSHSVNATGTLEVLEAARNAGNLHVVVASSSSVYGANSAMPKSEDLACMPMSPYAVSKLAGENYAAAYAKCYDLPVLPFRFFNVFGPLQSADHAYAAVIPAFISAALAGAPLVVNGDGKQSRDFTYVDTVTSVLTDAVVRRVTGGSVNLALGTRTTLLELIELLESVLGRELDRVHMPTRPGDVRHSQADPARLRELFPAAIPTELGVGVRETVKWFGGRVAD